MSQNVKGPVATSSGARVRTLLRLGATTAPWVATAQVLNLILLVAAARILGPASFSAFATFWALLGFAR